MSYVVPQVKVFQEFIATPAAIANPLRAFIVGPNFFLQKFENGDGLLGQYDPNNDTAFSWPNRPAGAVVDQLFTKVTVKNALLRYYSNTAGVLTDEVKAVVSEPNRVRAEAVNFKASGVTWPLNVGLNNRDVAIGDLAHVFANVSGSTVELWSKITDIVVDKSVSSVAAPTADAGNQPSSLEGGSGSDNVSNTGGRSVATGTNFHGYDGLVDGHAVETYTLEITTASISSVGALAKVTSASGTDDATDVSIVTVGQIIGSRNGQFSWGGVGDWSVGDKFTITFTQDFKAPEVRVSGSFNSDADTTYIVEVTKGGRTGIAQVSVSTTNGLDVSGPHVVNDNIEFAIGTKGVKFAFFGFQGGSSSSGGAPGGPLVIPGDGLLKGDKWYVVATGRADQGFKTLVFADNLPVVLQARQTGVDGQGLIMSSSLIAAVDMNLELFVVRTITLPRENFPDAPNTNWEQSDTQITINANANIFDSDFVDNNGNQVALALDADSSALYSSVYTTYRALLQTFSNDVSTITSIADVVTTLGEISTDNPLALGVWHALRNSNGTSVKYMSVATNDNVGYSATLDKATGRRDLYTIVPMTKDGTIQNTIAGHVDALSAPAEGQWRIAIFNRDSSALSSLIDLGELFPLGGITAYVANDLIATVSDDPDASGIQFTIVQWDGAVFPVGGGFVDMGVRAGDIFRTNFAGDGFGGSSFEDYVIDKIVSNQQLRLVSGPGAASTVARKFSIQRSFTKDEEATEYGKKAGAFSARRIYMVWPDKIEDAAGVQIDGFYAAAAIAGLISGVVPQQGLTNVALEGFTAVTRTTDYFADTQLNIMAGSGVWVIAQDPDTGEIFTRHEVSTDTTDLKKRELMIVKNVDAISFTFLSQLEPLIGRSNVTPRMLIQLRRQVLGTIDFLKAQGSTPSLGGQLIGAEIVELRQHAVNLDQVVIELNLTAPFPLNVIELHLVV